jgi:ATP-dependent exoDNAse (exonuclease V) alpha subunit
METSTLQPRLASGVQPDTGEKCLCVLDESSLASIRQMHDFIDRRHCNDRVLLVGDSRQHEAVEAGRPFAQLQEVERVGGDERFAGNAVVAINRDAFNSPHL